MQTLVENLKNLSIPVFPMFLGIILLMSIMSIRLNRANRKDKQMQQAFWDRENEANATRAADISNLDYINIPLELMPLEVTNDPIVQGHTEALKALSTQKILNLTGYSNTDLKLSYGAANLDALSAADDNFTALARTIADLGEQYAKLGYTDEAIAILEYGIGWGSDVTKNYTLLGELYCQNGEYSRVDDLKESASKLRSLSKSAILRSLDEL